MHDLGVLERGVGVALLRVGLVGRVDLVRRVELRIVLAQHDVVLLGREVDADEARGIARGLEAVGDDGGDDLAAVRDRAGLEHGEVELGVVRHARRVALPEDGEDAGDGERLLGVDVADGPLRDRRSDDGGVGDALDLRLVGVARLARHLQATLDAVDRCADDPRGSDGHRLSSSSVRTMTRRARGTLNAFSGSGSAAASSASAASPNASSVAGRPRSASSALQRPPRNVRDGAERDPAVLHDAVAHVERGGHGDEGERERRALAHLAVRRAPGDLQRRQLDGGHELPRTQLGVALRLVAGEAVQPRHGDRAGAVAALDVDARAQRGERDRHVRRVRRDAGLGVPEDRVVAMMARPGRTTRPRLALVARLRHVGEVRAARALQQVAADRRHVPQLTGRAGEHRLREHRVRVAHEQAGGQVGVAHRGADPQPAAVELLDPVVREARDVDEHVGRLDAELHEVDEVRPAAEVARRRARVVEEGDRARGVRRPLVGEGPHRAASWMAGTMFA